MLGQLLQPEIDELIRNRSFAELRGILVEWTPQDIAELIDDVTAEDRAIVFRILPRDLALEVFEYLDIDSQESLLKAMGQEEVASVLNDMSPDDRTTLLEELPGEVTKQLINLLTPEERSVAISLLGYPKDSIGRLMSPYYVWVKQHWTVTEALDHVRRHGHDSESLLVLYVIDEKGLLLDDIRIRTILLAPLESKIESLMDKKFVALKATDDQEAAISAFKDYDREALPVTDSRGLLIGIVTVDDVFDVEEEEVTEDIQKLGGMQALEDPYMDVPFLQMVKKRAGWLVLLLFGEMLTTIPLAYFEDELAKALVLTLFIPLIISSGGNSGSQASTLVIRALALGEVTLKDWWRIMKREFLSGVTLGGILGLIGFLRIAIWSRFSTVYGPDWFLVALTVGIALVGIVMWGTLAGSMLPLLLRKMKFDPAASSTPFVATLVDVTGLAIYFAVAALILLSGGAKPPELISPIRQAEVTQPIELRWSTEGPSSLYQAQVAIDSTFKTSIRLDTSLSNSSVTVNNLEPGKAYYWRVRGGNHTAYGDWSSVSAFRTLQKE